MGRPTKVQRCVEGMVIGVQQAALHGQDPVPHIRAGMRILMKEYKDARQSNVWSITKAQEDFLLVQMVVGMCDFSPQIMQQVFGPRCSVLEGSIPSNVFGPRGVVSWASKEKEKFFEDLKKAEDRVWFISRARLFFKEVIND